MDRLSQMATFVKTVQLGSFSAAADDLNLSPQPHDRQINSWLYLRTIGTEIAYSLSSKCSRNNPAATDNDSRDLTHTLSSREAHGSSSLIAFAPSIL